MPMVKIRLEITAHGYHTVEVERDVIKHLLNEDGDDFEESAMEELPVDIQHFGLKAFAAIDQAVDFEAVVNALDFEVSEMELLVPKAEATTPKIRRGPGPNGPTKGGDIPFDERSPGDLPLELPEAWERARRAALQNDPSKNPWRID